jgi:CheY-like chemotaxis protein
MKKHILLVHENKNELKSFMEIVNTCHGVFKCTYASNGAHALEMLRYLEPDLIYIDYNLGDITAQQLVMVIRYGQKHDKAGIYLYGGIMDDDTGKTIKLSDVSGCLEKTSDLRTMLMQFNSKLSMQQTPVFHR